MLKKNAYSYSGKRLNMLVHSLIMLAKDKAWNAIKNIKEVTKDLLPDELSDPYKKLSTADIDASVVYIVMQYRLAMEGIVRSGEDREELQADLIAAIGTCQRLAAKVFDHIHYSNPNRELFK